MDASISFMPGAGTNGLLQSTKQAAHSINQTPRPLLLMAYGLDEYEYLEQDHENDAKFLKDHFGDELVYRCNKLAANVAWIWEAP
jgi:hypothetical protein